MANRTGDSGNNTILGTASDDTLSGLGGNDTLDGGSGADTLNGGAGNDRLLGGGGNDVLYFDAADTRGLDGGAGTDTLRFSGRGQALDLRAATDDAYSGIEVIDLNDSGAQLTLDRLSVLNLSSTSNTLRIEGGSTDTVHAAGSGWSFAGLTVASGDSYRIFVNGAVTLQIEAGITHDLDTSAISLARLDGTNGFRLEGIDAYDSSGISVASAGDVNGDGFDDLIVGAVESSIAESYVGESYVVFGKAGGFPSRMSLGALNGTNGFRLDGINAFDGSGRSVASSGDVNGDGFADLIIGALGGDPGANAAAGESYVVFGHPGRFPSRLSLGVLNGTNGFRLDGIDANDHSGYPVASAGDVNGDGLGDLIIGAPQAGPGGGSYAGESYVVFGNSGEYPPGFSLGALNGSNGFRLDGIDAFDGSGNSVASAGDVNGDGFDDLIIGAPGGDAGGDTDAGESYVVFGHPGESPSRFSLGALNGKNGFRLDGIDAFDRSGYSVASAGDMNGDGFGDLIIGAPDASPGGDISAGESYVVFGKSSGFASRMSLGTLNGTNGFRLDGVDAGDGSGFSVASAGDVNGDGFDDLIIGAFRADPNGDFYGGESYVVFGQSGGFASSLSLGALNGTNGFRLDGVDAGDVSGSSVASAGDVNGDGFADLIVGAFGADPDGDSGAGESYVVFGGDFLGVVDVLGTAAANTLRGTDRNDTLNGLGGNDRLEGRSGNDVLFGGAGVDRLIGGAGNDLYFIDRANEIDKALPDAGIDTIRSTVDYTLGAQQEHLTLLGNAALNGTGSAGANVLTGNDGNNRLQGQGGNDTLIGNGGSDRLIGGAGNDFYVVDRASEIDKALPDAGNDAVQSSVSYTLGANQEHLKLTGSAARDGTGNAGANTLFGNSAANQLNGLNGNDTLTGASGNDTESGGAGNDTLNGGPGNDRLLGGGGNDTLIFDAADTRGVDGGAGTDTLKVSGVTTADLITLNAVSARFTNLEIIDLSATGTQALVLDAATVTGLSSTTDELIVRGTAADTVNAGSGWNFAGLSVVSGETYEVFSQGAATLRIATSIGHDLDISAFSLALLNGANGFRLEGIDAYDASGKSVSSAGDVNGDGFDDLVIGANGADPNGNVSGESYVVFGASSIAYVVSLSALNGANGFRLDGIDPSDFSGFSVSSSGDVNGDGFDDLLIGAFYADPNGSSSGESYIVFGAGSFTSALSLSALNGTNGFRLDGIDAADRSGHSVSAAGDVNGDGFDDVLIGAYWADPNGTYSGESYVVFGGGNFASALSLSSLDGANGFRLDGIDADDRSGFSVSSAGDVNGDGFDDLLIGAVFGDPDVGRSGQSYVVFGGGSFASTLSLSALNGTNGFRLDGVDNLDYSGHSVSTAGDVNGDGFDDLLIGAFGADPNGERSGESYVVFGGSGFASELSLSSLNGTNGFRLDGIDASDYSGASVSSAGDVNGDGFDDLLIGAFRADPNGSTSGESYVVFGGGSFVSALSLSALNGTNGFRLDGIDTNDKSGFSVSSAGDVNGDGFDDLLIGASEADPDAYTSGESYVIFGGDFRDEVDFLGTAGNDTLTGTGADEILIGGLGNDTLNGAGGNDVVKGAGDDDIISGGAGDDVLEGGAGSDSLNGGAGNDRLFGDEGVDTLDGGTGNDVLVGGGDNDIFLFNDALGASNVDTIMDFGGAGATALDVIRLDNAIFAALSDGALSGTAFEASDGQTSASTASGRIIYDTASGALYYDVDGSGGSAAVQFALIASDVDGLSAADFVVI